MSREEIEKLLGGYATGTLSEAERQRLFEAALEDQEIFAALAREQDFKDLLETPGAREELLAALASEPVLAAAALPATAPEKAGFWSWLTQPWPWAVAATAAFTAILFFALRPQPQPVPVETAAVVQPESLEQETTKQEPAEPAKPVERAAAPAPKREPAPAPRALGGAAPARLPAALPAPPAAVVTSADREVREEAKKAVAIASAEKVKVDGPRPVEADRKAEAAAVSAIAPPSPRKEMPPGATVQPALRDDLARGGAPAPQLAKANEAAPALRYRLAEPAFRAGREAEIFVTASREGVLVVQRRAGEAWERILTLRVRENQETRVSVPTRDSDREVELDLSLTDAVSLGSSAGFRRADRQETPQGLRVRIPRAQ